MRQKAEKTGGLLLLLLQSSTNKHMNIDIDIDAEIDCHEYANQVVALWHGVALPRQCSALLGGTRRQHVEGHPGQDQAKLDPEFCAKPGLGGPRLPKARTMECLSSGALN